MIARIAHKAQCQHPQTPAARRTCRAAAITAATTLPAGYHLERGYGKGMSAHRARWTATGPEGWTYRTNGDTDAERQAVIARARAHATAAPQRAAEAAASAAIAAAEAIVRDARTAQIARLTAERGPLATPAQVNYILDLLRRHTGEPGFMTGPVDRAGIQELSKTDASAYINSLTGSY